MKLIRLPLAHREAAQKCDDDDLKAGLIRPSKSPYAAPLFFIPKHNGNICPVLDYRWLNSHTIRDKYPLPHIGDIIDRLQG
jgi:hypothetical protein